jgi:hypothetical protein
MGEVRQSQLIKRCQRSVSSRSRRIGYRRRKLVEMQEPMRRKGKNGLMSRYRDLQPYGLNLARLLRTLQHSRCHNCHVKTHSAGTERKAIESSPRNPYRDQHRWRGPGDAFE